MTPFRPKHPRLRDLQLAGVMGHMLDCRFDWVPEDAWLRQMADEVLPWEFSDEQIMAMENLGDGNERARDFRQARRRPTIH